MGKRFLIDSNYYFHKIKVWLICGRFLVVGNRLFSIFVNLCVKKQECLKSTYCIPTDKIFTHIANFSVNLDFVPTIHLTQTVIGVGQVMTRVRNLCHYGTLYRRSLSYIDVARAIGMAIDYTLTFVGTIGDYTVAYFRYVIVILQ